MTDYVRARADWQDYLAGGTPILGENLDTMEAGIDTAHSELATEVTDRAAGDVATAAAAQPLDSDLTAIAALTTTAFGRSVLEAANAAALLSLAAGAAASHVHSGGDITSGTVADARIDAAIARDAEVAAAYQPLDSDLTALAALTTTAFGRSLLEAANAGALRTLAAVVYGTDVPAQATFDDHSARHETGGADAIKIDDLAAGDDNTDLNASTTKHGLLKKLSNVATEYLDGTGAFSTPASGGGVSLAIVVALGG